MTRAVVFLTATLLLASFGAIAQNNSSPSREQKASVQASASAQSATEPAAAQSPAHASQGMTTASASKGIEKSAQGKDPGTGKRGAELPQTSTILPLLGLLGLGSLVAGWVARR